MKKIIVLVLAVCMLLPVVAFASVDAELEKAIIAAKKVIDVPQEYSEFNYNVRENDGRKKWNLYWEDEDRNKGRISVYITDADDILNYSHYVYNEEKGKLITLDEAIEVATGFAAKILGDNFAKMRIESRDKILLDSYSDSFCIDYNRYENDIPVYGQGCRVTVGKFSGRVESYNGFAYDRKSVFEQPENLIGTDKAISEFVQGDGMTLAYRTYREYGEDKELKIFPVYRYNGRDYVIDAQTGESLLMKDLMEEAEDNNVFYAGDSMTGAGGALKNEVALTPQEREAVDELVGLLTAEEAREIVEKTVPEFKNHSFDQSRFYKNYVNGFSINLEYKFDEEYFGNASVDAETGEIKSFSFSTDRLTDSGEEITDEKVNEFAKSIAGDKFDSFTLDNRTEHNWDDRRFVYYNFARMENGVPVEGNSLYVQADVKKGYINQYSINWDEIDVFPDISNVKSKEEVLKSVAEKKDLGLCYINGRLVYGFFGQGSLNPHTGAFINYNGKEIKEKKVPVYSDLEGHWCKETIDRLIENGLYLEDDKFCPDEAVNQRDFVKILGYYTVYNDDEEVESVIRNSGYFDEINLDAPVSRKEAARVFAKNMGFGEIASRAELFKLPFDDCEEDEFTGYIAICKSYGIMQGKADGTFGSGDMLTRAEVATMVYRKICR